MGFVFVFSNKSIDYSISSTPFLFIVDSFFFQGGVTIIASTRYNSWFFMIVYIFSRIDKIVRLDVDWIVYISSIYSDWYWTNFRHKIESLVTKNVESEVVIELRMGETENDLFFFSMWKKYDFVKRKNLLTINKIQWSVCFHRPYEKKKHTQNFCLNAFGEEMGLFFCWKAVASDISSKFMC